MRSQLLLQLLGLLDPRLQGGEDDYDLTFDLVRLTDDRRLCHGRMANRSGLDLGVAQPVAGDLQDVVNTTLDKEVSVLIPSALIPSQVVSGMGLPVELPVGLHVSVRILVEGSEHCWPWSGLYYVAALTHRNRISFIIQDVHAESWKRQGSRTWLQRRDRQR